MFYLMTHSTHFIYGYMVSHIWLRTIQIVRKETRCRHIGYSFRLTARVLLYAPSHRQDSTYHILCYTSRGALAGMRNSSMGPPHEGSIRQPIAPWANALTTELVIKRTHLNNSVNKPGNNQEICRGHVWRGGGENYSKFNDCINMTKRWPAPLDLWVMKNRGTWLRQMSGGITNTYFRAFSNNLTQHQWTINTAHRTAAAGEMGHGGNYSKNEWKNEWLYNDTST